MDSRIQILTIAVATLLLIVVIELVRRRRLLERYALLWLGSSILLLGLAIWRDALDTLAAQIGVAYPPNALFIVAFGSVLWLLLHFSVAVSRLNDQVKILAQRQAIIEERVQRAERTSDATMPIAEDERSAFTEVVAGRPRVLQRTRDD